LSFDAVRVPRANLLNRYADVSEDGTYSSPIDNRGRRFFTMLGTLVQGGSASVGPASTRRRSPLTIAVKYALFRRQFGEPGGGEELLLDYGMHQRRLFPLLARTYALHFAQEVLALELHEVFSSEQVVGDEEAERRRRAWSPGPRAPRRSAPGTPPAPSRSAARRVAAPATSRSTGSLRSRRTPTCSPRSRATTTY
jgi:acyl-CoA oxidase